MSSGSIITLFGDEELIPEALSAAPKVGEAEVAPLQSWKPEKQYYTIGEVAKIFDVRTSHIRYWTTEFDVKVRTTRKGDRLYTPDAIRELRAIYGLVKERGFTIAGAKAQLKAEPALPQTADLRLALLRLRNQLLLIRNELL